MQVVLKVTSETAGSRMTVIRQGQILQVGRTSWADFSIPDDDSMGDVHFSLECTPSRCIVRSLSGELPTLLDGEEITESEVSHGAQITAGRTNFTVALEGYVYTDAPSAGDAGDADGEHIDSGFKHVEIPLARDVAAKCELDDAAKQQLAGNMTVRDYVDTLKQHGLTKQAIVFLAAAMPKREAVWWAVEACGGSDSDSLPDSDQKALQTAGAWCADPIEENRRAAEEAAKAGQLLTAPSCVAMAAFLSGGSIAAPDMPEVPPPDHLTGHTAACAINFAATSGDPMKIDESRARLLELGYDVADGKNRWEE